MHSRNRRFSALVAATLALTVLWADPAAAGPPTGSAAHHEAPPHETAHPAATPPADLSPLVPTADSIAAVAKSLPDDVVAASESLVNTLFGPDDAAAVAATGELLRRAGLPLVSADGPVVAVPDDVTIISDPVDVEMLPPLTRAVRDGTEFSPQQVIDTLTFLGVTTSPLTPELLIGTLAAWGKDADAPMESQAAGSTVRALAHARGQLLVPAALIDEATQATLASNPESLTAQQLSLLSAPGRLSGLDPLQFVLFVAHATGDVTGPVVEVPGAASFSALRAGPETVPCKGLATSPDAGKATAKTILRTDIKAGAEIVKEGAGKKIESAFGAYDKAADVVSTTLLLLGATLDLMVNPTATHFRHESGDPSRDVAFLASAAFSSPLANRHLSCWNLAGIDLPPSGPLNGFRVRWEVFGSLPLLQTKSEDSDKLLHGELTKDGISTVRMYPRTETHPPKSGESVPEQTLSQIIVASLDKDDFPFKLGDLLGLINPKEVGVEKAWDIAVAWFQKVGLPSKRMRYPVSFHAISPYVIQSVTTIQVPGFASLEMDADLYSCKGPSGPWQGSVSLSGEPQAILIYAGELAGVHADAANGTAVFPLNFMLNGDSPSPQSFPFGKDLALVVTLDPDAVAAQEQPQSLSDTWDRLGNHAIVGEGSYISGGIDIREVAATTAGGLFQGAEFPVVGVMRDDRCPGATYWDDKFDSQ